MTADHPSPSPPFLLALSGPSSSGKTTLATALHAILPQTTLIIHADDFYKPDSEIPTTNEGWQDWDCAQALDAERFRDVLLRVRKGEWVDADVEGMLRQGALLEGHRGGGLGDGMRGLDGQVVKKLKEEVCTWPIALRRRKVVIVEGFLLFGESVRLTLAPLFDMKILLRTTSKAAKQRRESRNGYVTLEGFWKDPEGYFEKTVWPAYVREHGWVFETEGGLEESVDAGENRKEKLWWGGLEWNREEGLQWVLRVLRKELESEDQ